MYDIALPPRQGYVRRIDGKSFGFVAIGCIPGSFFHGSFVLPFFFVEGDGLLD